MNKEIVVSPLTKHDLTGAAYLCLDAAAYTDLGQFPPGSGISSRRKHHERRHHFRKARALVNEGVTNLLELGLSPEDCAWAAGEAHRVKDQEGWLARFQTAERELRRALQPQV